MRLAVLSDIHDNLPALEAELADVQQYEADGFIIAGDLTGGPQTMETLRMLRSLGTWIIRGNDDLWEWAAAAFGWDAAVNPR